MKFFFDGWVISVKYRNSIWFHSFIECLQRFKISMICTPIIVILHFIYNFSHTSCNQENGIWEKIVAFCLVLCRNFMEICRLNIDLYISNKNTFWKNERGFWILVCCEKKPLSVLGYSFSFAWDIYFKNMCQIGKFWDPKIRA